MKQEGEVMGCEPKIPGGYILLSRKIIESEIWDKPPLYMKVWIYLLSKAQHKPFKKMDRGQLFVSIPELMEACSWYVGYRKEKPSKDQIYKVLNWLRSESEAVHESQTKETMITTTKATHGLLVNISNYAFYQDPKNYEANAEPNNEEQAKATREQRPTDNINKNVKNDKNEKKRYGENVLLKSSEYETLVSDYGEEIVEEKIQDLDEYISNKGNKYKNHNLTIRKWMRKDGVKKKSEIEEEKRKREEREYIEYLKGIKNLGLDYWQNIDGDVGKYEAAMKELEEIGQL